MTVLKSDNAELKERLDASEGNKEKLAECLAASEGDNAKLAEKIGALEKRIAELERDGDLAVNEKRAAKSSSSSPPRTPLQKPASRKKTVLSPFASLVSRVFSLRATRKERKRREGNKK